MEVNWSRAVATVVIVAILVMLGGMYWKGCGPFSGTTATPTTRNNVVSAAGSDAQRNDSSDADAGTAASPAADAATPNPTLAADSGIAPTPRPAAVDAGSTASPTPAADAGTTASPAADAAVVAQPAPADAGSAPTPIAGRVVGTVPQGYVCPTGRSCYGSDQWPTARCDNTNVMNDSRCARRMRRYRDYNPGAPNPNTSDDGVFGTNIGPNPYFDCSRSSWNGRAGRIPPSPDNVGSYLDDMTQCVFVAAAQ